MDIVGPGLIHHPGHQGCVGGAHQHRGPNGRAVGEEPAGQDVVDDHLERPLTHPEGAKRPALEYPEPRGCKIPGARPETVHEWVVGVVIFPVSRGAGEMDVALAGSRPERISRHSARSESAIGDTRPQALSGLGWVPRLRRFSVPGCGSGGEPGAPTTPGPGGPDPRARTVTPPRTPGPDSRRGRRPGSTEERAACPAAGEGRPGS